MPNLVAFSAALESFAKDKLPEELVKLHRYITMELLRRVVKRTPVDTGVARANWQVDVNSAPETVIDTPLEYASIIRRANGQLSGLKPFAQTHVVNNAPHILTLEFGLFDPPSPGPSKDRRPDRLGRVLVKDGFSMQAPHGMVNVTLGELMQMFP